MKKTLSVILAIALMATMLAACGSKAPAAQPETPVAAVQPDANFNAEGYPVVKEPIELNAATYCGTMSGDFNEMQIFKELAEKTGVKVNFDMIPPTAWPERKSLMLASNELPDLIYGGDITMNDQIKYSRSGMFLPLNDLVDKYAPNIKKMLDDHPTLKNAMTLSDGNYYSLPFYDEFLPENIPDTMFINKTWLDKLGLDVPTTTEEFYEVLKAFKDKDPNGNGEPDEIPLTYIANNTNLGDFSLWGSFGVLDNSKHLMVKDGKVLFSLTQDGYKEGIQYFNKLYKEGLLDFEVFTQDRTQYASKGSQEEMKVGVLVAYTPENFLGAERTYNDYIDLLPLKGPNGDQLWNRYDMGYYTDRVVITSANKHPEATIRWLDEQFAEEMSVRLHWGEVGKNIERTENGWKILSEAPEGMSVDEYRFKTVPAYHAPGVILAETYDKIELATDKAMKAERYKKYDPYAAQEYLPAVTLTSEEQQEISTIFVDIDGYVKSMKAKWVSGESDVEADWDKYVETLGKMQVDRYVEIYQAAYDRAMGK